ncbi:MAG: DnaJ domain-containing protein [Myxococcales bacterium]|nr:DnaJ domain-containing protein [Myxococcales bacterium]
MGAPVLLVHDDIATIAAVRRLLAREGHEVVLATSAADALIAFGHYLPSLIVLAPSVEQGRGQVVLEELAQHPDARLARVLLLGESIPGFGAPVVPLPLDGASFLRMVEETMRASSDADQWQVLELPRFAESVAAPPVELEDWRATAPTPADDELKRLEQEVLAEAARRRRQREAPRETPATPPPQEADEEASFAGIADEPSLPPDLAELISTPPTYRAEQPAPTVEEVTPLDQQDAQAGAEEWTEEPAADEAAGSPEAIETADGVAPAAEPLPEGIDWAGTASPAPDDAAFSAGMASSLPEYPQAVEPAEVLGPLPSEQLDMSEPAGSAEEAETLVGSEPAGSAEEAETLVGGEPPGGSGEPYASTGFSGTAEEAPHLDGAEPVGAAEPEPFAAAERPGGPQLAEEAHLEAAEEVALLERARLEALERERSAAAEAAEREIEAARAREKAEELAALERDALETAARAAAIAEAAEHDAFERAQRAREEAEEAERRLLEERAEKERLAFELEAARITAEEQAQALALEREEQARKAAEELALLARERDQAKERERAMAAEAAEREIEAGRAHARAEELAQSEQEAREAAARALSAVEEAEREARERQERDRAEAEHAAEVMRREREEKEKLAFELEAARLAAQRAREEAREASKRAEKAIVPLSIPGRPALGAPAAGSVEVEKLAGLVAQLCLSRAEVRLELRSPEVLRVLWLRRAQVVAATSSAPYESMLDRARRDGLIDGRQEEQLRLLRAASSAELLEVLKSRGHLREAEVVPLVQRYTEQIALEALSEPQSLYRLAQEAPPADVALAASPRPALNIAVEALRRALEVESMLEGLGGLAAVPGPLESDLDARALGFSERERKLLSAVDGESTVEDLLLAVGIRQDLGLKAITVARCLGLIEVRPPTSKAQVPPDLDLKRLEAKYEQVQEADYFGILGVPRSAGAEEVQRAFQVLAAEFHPMKYSGHADPALQHRAQRIHELLSEAAQVLQDDRLRSEYARHLID